jgi:rod shape-determining protein MreC
VARAVRSGSRVDTVLLVSCCVLALFASVLPVNVREAIAGGLRRTVVAPLVALQQQAERGRAALVTREATAYRVDSFALRNMQLTQLENENTRLRRMLGLGGHLGWGFVTADALHGRGIGDDNRLTLTVGSRAGVQRNALVVAPDGLVGQVVTVDPAVSIAIVWTNPDFRVSAMSADGGTFGIVQSHTVGLSQGEPERFLLELRGVAFRTSLKPGTLIVSSGLGGVYPRGIPIGTVLRELRSSEGWARTYLMLPAVRPADVSNVMIVSPQRAAAGLESVWRSVLAADSAARRIAQAGDSAVRSDSALAAVRRAMADSTRRASTPPSPDSSQRGGASKADTTGRSTSPRPKVDSAKAPRPTAPAKGSARP